MSPGKKSVRLGKQTSSKFRSSLDIWNRRGTYKSLTEVVEGMVPSQEERAMSFNTGIITSYYWDIKIKVRENYTQLLML